ncbi:MAG: hypothetical protein AAGA20_00715 [Planctomycetota bacterium]
MKKLHCHAASATAFLLFASSGVRAAQFDEGDLVVRANPNGNTVAFHGEDGQLQARGDGPDEEWRVGVAVTHDLGWVTFRLDIAAQPAGWRMMRYSPDGTFVGETLVPQIAEVAQYGVGRTTDGVILVADPFRNRVHRYAENGTFLGFVDGAALGVRTHLVAPIGDGSFWVFEDGFLPQSRARGVRVDRNGAVLGSVTLDGFVRDVDALEDGTFWASNGTSTVTQYAADGSEIQSFDFDLGVTPAGQLRAPRSVVAREDGTLWVAVGLTTQLTRLDASGTVLEFFDTAADYENTEVRFVPERTSIGTPTCDGEVNQTGAPGTLAALDSVVIADNNLVLSAADLPSFTFGFFLNSRVGGFVANPGGSAGNLCLSGSIGRFADPGMIMNSGPDGRIELAVDLTRLPTPLGFVAAAPGETWHFQAWYRDVSQGQPTSNFTGALRVQLL